MINHLLEDNSGSKPVNNKEALEIIKLEYEIRSLQKKGWQKIRFWQVMLTILLSAGTLFVLYKNGAFDFQTKILELRKENLVYEINSFENRKQVLLRENVNLQYKLLYHQKRLDTLSQRSSGKDVKINYLQSVFKQAKEVIRLINMRDSVDEYFDNLMKPARSTCACDTLINPEELWKTVDIWRDSASANIHNSPGHSP